MELSSCQTLPKQSGVLLDQADAVQAWFLSWGYEDNAAQCRALGNTGACILGNFTKFVYVCRYRLQVLTDIYPEVLDARITKVRLQAPAPAFSETYAQCTSRLLALVIGRLPVGAGGQV